MSMSYGEIAAITDEWNKWTETHSHDADSCLQFIEEECAEVYPDGEDQGAIFTLISCIEEWKEYIEERKE